MDINQLFSQSQQQRQTYKLAQKQIQALRLLASGNLELRDEIFKAANENPALEIVSDPLAAAVSPAAKSGSAEFSGRTSLSGQEKSDAYQQALENTEDRSESLQEHLIHQLNSMRLSPDEYALSRALIFNLDQNGCYGSMLAPETLIDKRRPLQTKQMLERCMDRIQRMDPVGTCCRTPEESLFVQAKINGDAPPLALFLLDGHLELVNPPVPEKILKKINLFRAEWHKKSFAPELPIDSVKITEESVKAALSYILGLNPRPAAGFRSEPSGQEFDAPDVVLTITRIYGRSADDDFSRGIVSCDKNSYFQVKYASGMLPEIRIAPDFLKFKGDGKDKNMQKMRRTFLASAKDFIDSLKFRESSIVFQGCDIVSRQKEFFVSGPGHILPLTRRQIALDLGLSASTVTRTAGKRNSRYFQTDWGLFPASYFFSSGVNSEGSGDKKISAESIKIRIQKIIGETEECKKKPLSDLELTEILNRQGIKIARRTVAKYRAQAGIGCSFSRNSRNSE